MAQFCTVSCLEEKYCAYCVAEIMSSYLLTFMLLNVTFSVGDIFSQKFEVTLFVLDYLNILVEEKGLEFVVYGNFSTR